METAVFEEVDLVEEVRGNKNSNFCGNWQNCPLRLSPTAICPRSCARRQSSIAEVIKGLLTGDIEAPVVFYGENIFCYD